MEVGTNYFSQNFTVKTNTKNINKHSSFEKEFSKDDFSLDELKERREKIREYFIKDLEEFDKLKEEHNEKIRQNDPSYEPSRDSKYFKEKRLYSYEEILLDGKVQSIDKYEYSQHKSILHTINANTKLGNFRLASLEKALISNSSNEFENAPELENFINNRIKKGDSKEKALERAEFYIKAGLLPYGNQSAIDLDYPFTIEDKQNHGFHLIENEKIKTAVLKTFESLEGDELGEFFLTIFPREDLRAGKSLLDKLGEFLINENSKLELKEENIEKVFFEFSSFNIKNEKAREQWSLFNELLNRKENFQ